MNQAQADGVALLTAFMDGDPTLWAESLTVATNGGVFEDATYAIAALADAAFAQLAKGSSQSKQELVRSLAAKMFTDG